MNTDIQKQVEIIESCLCELWLIILGTGNDAAKGRCSRIRERVEELKKTITLSENAPQSQTPVHPEGHAPSMTE